MSRRDEQSDTESVDGFHRNSGGRYDLADPAPIDYDDEAARERYVAERARYLGRVTDLRENVCEALAWSELGTTASGTARRMGTSASTVRGWRDEVEAEYGWQALESRPQSAPVEVLE